MQINSFMGNVTEFNFWFSGAARKLVKRLQMHFKYRSWLEFSHDALFIFRGKDEDHENIGKRNTHAHNLITLPNEMEQTNFSECFHMSLIMI